nr:unnamed protein product [Digitaria exilis]
MMSGDGGGWTDWTSHSDSGSGAMGGSENAATVLRKMLCSAAASAWRSSRSLLAAETAAAEAGKTVSIMASQSLTSSEMRSVVKNGCCSTLAMTGSRSTPPVRLSNFLRILASPV